jgi:hypothetical protein
LESVGSIFIITIMIANNVCIHHVVISNLGVDLHVYSFNHSYSTYIITVMMPCTPCVSSSITSWGLGGWRNSSTTMSCLIKLHSIFVCIKCSNILHDIVWISTTWYFLSEHEGCYLWCVVEVSGHISDPFTKHWRTNNRDPIAYIYIHMVTLNC